MRGVSVPSHEYARVAAMHVHSLSIHPNHRDPSLGETVRALTACTRAYSRVLLRLRAQAEKEASFQSLTQPQHPPSTPSSKSTGGYSSRGYTSRVSSRAPSPTTSNNSHSYNGAGGHGLVSMQQTPSQTSLTFRSPLFRLRRAPLLRVFVPSPEGDWLSDKSVLECEAECKRAGIMHLLRLGDVIWDVAVGDEGNVGRLVWDGSYLIVSLTFLESRYERPPCHVGLCFQNEIDLFFSFSSFFDAGSGLYLFNSRRSSKVSSYIGFPAILFPSCHSNGVQRQQPYYPYGPESMGRRDRYEPSTPSRSRAHRNVRFQEKNKILLVSLTLI